jgi:hypothetical protein
MLIIKIFKNKNIHLFYVLTKLLLPFFDVFQVSSKFFLLLHTRKNANKHRLLYNRFRQST